MLLKETTKVGTFSMLLTPTKFPLGNPQILFVLSVVLFCTITPSSISQYKTIGPPGGRVIAVAVHPGDPDIIYANTDAGALFKTTDGGITSQIINPDFISGVYRKITIHPTQPETVYAMGRRTTNGGKTWSEQLRLSNVAFNFINTNIIYATNNDSLKISRDGGTTWSLLHKFRHGIGSIVVSPSDTNILYSIADGGVYKSSNSGLSWIKISDSTLESHDPNAIDISPLSSSMLFVGTDVGISKSTDGGNLWEYKTQTTPVNHIVAASDSIFYAVTGDYLWGLMGNCLKTTNQGETWQEKNNGLPKDVNRYLYALAVNPKSINQIITGTYGWGVYKTNDAGENWLWTRASSDFVHDIYFDPDTSNRLYVGTVHQGILSSNNEGKWWHVVDFGNYSTVPGGFRQLRFAPSNTNVGYVTGGAHGLFKTINKGKDWERTSLIGTFDSWVSTVAPHPANDSIVYAGYTGYMSRDLFVSTDQGYSFQNLNLTQGVGGIFDFQFDPNDENIIYVATSGFGIFRSTDAGKQWEQINTGIPIVEETYLEITSLSTFRYKPGTMYAAQFDALFYSSNYGSSWSRIDSTLKILAKNLNITKVYADQQHSGVLYTALMKWGQFATFSPGGFFRTTDNGMTWEKLYTGSVSTFSTDPSNSNKFYISTQGGIAIVYDSITVGVEPSEGETVEKYALYHNYPNPFNPSTTIRYTIAAQSNIQLTIYNILGQEVKQLFNGQKPAGTFETNWDGKNNNGKNVSSGIYFCRLNAKNKVYIQKLLLVR